MKKLTNEEFKEWKVLSLFLGIYKSEINFTEVAPVALSYAADMYKHSLDFTDGDEVVKLKSNIDLIQILFALTDKAVKGSIESKAFANDILNTIDINEIPTSAKICVLLELDPRKVTWIPKRDTLVLKALQEDSEFRQTVDIYNLGLEDMGAYDWKMDIDSLDYIEEDNNKPLKIEGYMCGNSNCAVYVNYNIKTKNIISHTINENHPKIKNLILIDDIELLAS